MRILLVGTGPLRHGGVAYYEKALSQVMVENNHSVTILGMDRTDFRSKSSKLENVGTDEFRQKGIEIYDIVSGGVLYFGTLRPLYHCRNASSEEIFKQFLSMVNPDIVHFQAARPASLIALAYDRGIPTIVSHHDYWFICCLGFLTRLDNVLCDGPHEGMNCAMYCYRRSSCLPVKSIKGIVRFVINYGPKGVRKFVEQLREHYRRYVRGNKQTYGMVYSPNEDLTAEELFPWVFRAEYMKWILSNKVDLNIAVSKYVRDKYVNFGVTSNRFQVLHSGFEYAQGFFDRVPKKRMDVTKPLVFGYVSPIFREKGLHVLVNAIEKLPKEDVRFIIYGHNSEPAYYSWIEKRCGLLQNVEFRGEFINYSDLPKIYSEFDILVIPPIMNDTSPRVVWEALSSKTPIIASRAGGIPDFVEDGVNGLLFETGNPDDLAKKITIILDNPDLINKFRSRIQRPKTINEHVSELINIYSELFKNKNFIKKL